MAKDSTPLCFRVLAKERDLIEAVSAYLDMSVSDFARTVCVQTASNLMRAEGMDNVIREIDGRTEMLKAISESFRATRKAEN
jgi:hypothetical protein